MKACDYFLFAIVLAMVGFPISMAFLTGALCMVLTRVLMIGEAFEAIKWKVVLPADALIVLLLFWIEKAGF